MRYVGALASIGLMLAVAGTAGAVEVTLSFNPNDWMNNYSTDVTKTRIQQLEPRLLLDGVAQSTDRAGYAGRHTTFLSNTVPEYGSTGIAGYQNQVTGVAIHDFNMWLADGINAPNWGEVLTQVLGSVPSGTAGNGWVAEVIDNPWPQTGVGSKLVQWYDVGYWDGDPGTPANPLVFGDHSFGTFTMTLDLNPTDVYGNPVDLSLGTQQRVWLGNYNNGFRFEGVTQMTVTDLAQEAPIPEPLTMAGLAMGIGGLVTYIRKRRKA